MMVLALAARMRRPQLGKCYIRLMRMRNADHARAYKLSAAVQSGRACYKRRRDVSRPHPEPSALQRSRPPIVAATAFAFADVTTKVTLHAEADVLTMALFRGIIGVPLLFALARWSARRRSR